MGNLFGHVYEGLVFMFVGLWWMYNSFKRQILRPQHESYYSSVSYDGSFHGKRYNFEIYAKIIAPLGGIAIESGIFSGYFGHIVVAGYQHITIYCLFCFHGIVDWLKYKNLVVIDSLEYLTLAISFTWYSLIFYFHTQTGHTKPLEDIIHTMGIAWCLGTAVSTLWESRTSDKFLASYLRSFFLLGLGTWFTQMPFILYSHDRLFSSSPNPNWDQNDVNNVQLAATMFGVHLLINSGISVVMFIFLRCVYRKGVSELALAETRYSKLRTCSPDEKRRLMDGDLE